MRLTLKHDAIRIEQSITEILHVLNVSKLIHINNPETMKYVSIITSKTVK